MAKKKVGLVGYGNYGRFVAGHLSRFFDIRIYDPAAGRRDVRSVLASDVILLAIPVASIAAFVKKAAGRLNPDAIVVDLSSVKMKPLGLLRRGLKNPVLGVHTLFGPESAAGRISGLPVVLTPGSAKRPAYLGVRRFLKKRLGLKVIELPAREHDRQMAWVQGLSHFVSMAMQNMAVPPLPHRTKSFDKLIGMNRLLRNTTWPLFETIEKHNPLAGAVRKKFIRELLELDRRLSQAGKRRGRT